MKSAELGYIYDEHYPYLQEAVTRSGELGYQLLSVAKNFGLIYKRLGLKSGDKLLDVGSCIGMTGHYLSIKGIHCYGVDVNLAALKEGQRLFGVEKRNTFIAGEASALPFVSGAFDAVISEDIFEHFPSEQFVHDAFTNMQRVLRPTQNKMFHKITVLEDVRHIDSDKSHFLKWPTKIWSEFFEHHGWRVTGNPTLRIPALGAYYGFFFIERI